MEPRHLYIALLKSRSLTTNALAEKLGGQVEQSQLNRFETGKTKQPRMSTLQPVADFFGVPLLAFYREDIAEQVVARLTAGETVEQIFPQQPQPIPEKYLRLDQAITEGRATSVPAGTANIIKPVRVDALAPAVQVQLTRFLRVIHRLPQAAQQQVLASAIEAALDLLPEPPTAGQ